MWRSGRLAIAFQEPLTTVLRVNAVNNREFRGSILTALNKSIELGNADGYTGEDLESAKFAVVAFLDEAVLNSANPKLADWRPLQMELFATSDAGKEFFEKLHMILKRGNSPDVADLLEVYDFCLLLGFRGEYRLKGEEALPLFVTSITKKILRIRKDLPAPKPSWSVPEERTPTVGTDVWVRSLLFAAIGCLVISVVLWIGFNSSIRAGVREIGTIVVQSSR